MIFEHQSKNKIFLFAIFAVFLLGGVIFLIWPRFFNQPKQITCTQEAKICPNGSSVGRTGPKCEFAPCPFEVNNNSWKTFTTNKGVTFQYPENLSTNYIRPQEWPPKLLIIDDAVFSCEQGGLGINGRPGMTIQKRINNIIYCIENVSEGTAGTFYTDYTYTFLKDSKLVKFSFTLAYPECANYNNPQKTGCEQERQTFDLDMLINRIAESVQL